MKRFTLVFVLLFSFSALSCKKKPPTPPTAIALSNQEAGATTSDIGGVVTDAPLATEVGMSILKKGGNAIDAAIATAFALAVVHPAAGNLGGGGFMVAYQNGKPSALDFRETAPRKATRDMFLKPGASDQHSHLASGVPGSVAGLYEAHQKLGSKKISWENLVAPAIVLADKGFALNANFIRSLTAKESCLRANPAAAALFFPSGTLPKIGDTWRNPDLADTLRRIAKEGAKGFYDGETAKIIDEDMKANGGLIDQIDLKNYKPIWRTPVTFSYHGYDLYSMPLPSSGGMALAMMAHILEPVNLPVLGYHSAAHLHLLAESFRRVFFARNTALGDPDFVKNPVATFLSTEWATTQRKSIQPDKVTKTESLTAAPQEGTQTTHFSVADTNGNAVGITTTINDWYGSCRVARGNTRGAGFVWNDEMSDFATNPGKPNQFGLVQGESNAIAPGKRMLSSMAPTIVTGLDGKVVMVLGAAGGPTIISSVFQILSNFVDFRQTFGHAASSARVHMQDRPGDLWYEKGGLQPEVLAKLKTMGHTLVEKPYLADAPVLGISHDPGGKPQAPSFLMVPEPRVNTTFKAGF